MNLVEILKDCPKGTKLYTPVWGEVTFIEVLEKDYVYPICIYTNIRTKVQLTKNGCLIISTDSECILFPSKDQRDWSKFSAPWYKKEKFDPKTLKPFDKVLVKRAGKEDSWTCNIFSSYSEGTGYDFECLDDVYENCIPYNDETKHLVGTSEDVPEYYRYWDNN